MDLLKPHCCGFLYFNNKYSSQNRRTSTYIDGRKRQEDIRSIRAIYSEEECFINGIPLPLLFFALELIEITKQSGQLLQSSELCRVE